MLGYEKLKAIKDKHAPSLLKNKAIHGVGIRVLEDKIIVYTEKATDEFVKSIPKKLDGVTVDYEEMPRVIPHELKSLNTLTTPLEGFQDQAYRPVAGGVMSSHIAGGGGTIGSWWWSRKLNKIIGVSNNHVMGNHSFTTPLARKRHEVTYGTLISVLTGTPTNINQLEDMNKFDDLRYIRPAVQTGTIDTISSTSLNVGDILTITGKRLGWRKGLSKVWFTDELGNKVEAIVKSWSQSYDANYTRLARDTTHYTFYYSNDVTATVEVYIPNLTGNLTLSIELEGDPIIQPNPDYYYKSMYQYAQLEDYLVNSPNADVAIISPISEEDIYPAIIAHGAINSSYRNYHHYEDLREYKPRGIMDKFCEKLPVVKTGRTSGTTYSAIYDPSFTFGLDYLPTMDTVDSNGNIISGGQVQHMTIGDIVLYYVVNHPSDTKSADSSLNFAFRGDSGSSVLVGTREDYNQWMQHYEATHKKDGTTWRLSDADFNTVETFLGKPIKDYENFFIGNYFGGVDYIAETSTTSQGSAVSDKAFNWASTWELEPLPEMIKTNSAEGISSTNITIISPANLFTNSANGQSSTTIDMQVLDITEIEPFSLQAITPSTKDSVNFTLEHHGEWIMSFNSTNGQGDALDTSLIVTHQITGKAEGVSSASSTALIVPIEITTNSANGIGHTSIVINEHILILTNPSNGFGHTSIEIDGTVTKITELQPFNLQQVTPALKDNVNFDLQSITITVFEYTSQIALDVIPTSILEALSTRAFEHVGNFTITIDPTSELYQVVNKLGDITTEIHPSGILYTPFEHLGDVLVSLIPNSTVQFGVNTEKPIRIGRMLITLPNGKVVEIGIVDTGRSRVKAHMRVQTKLNEMGEFDVVDINHPDASPVRIVGGNGNIYALSKY